MGGGGVLCPIFMAYSFFFFFFCLFFARAKKQDKIVCYQIQLEPQRDGGSAQLISTLGRFNKHIFNL